MSTPRGRNTALKYGANAADGYKAARVLFRRHPDLSLLFCGTDRMAMGAYDYLKETEGRSRRTWP